MRARCHQIRFDPVDGEVGDRVSLIACAAVASFDPDRVLVVDGGRVLYEAALLRPTSTLVVDEGGPLSVSRVAVEPLDAACRVHLDLEFGEAARAEVHVFGWAQRRSR